MPYVKCKLCNNEFYTKPSHIRRGQGKYCSKKCQYQSQRTGKYVTCSTCNKKIWRMPKELRNSKSGQFFCNKTCQTIWRNKYFSGKKHLSWKGGESTYRQTMERSGIKPICKICNNNDYRVLIVHHMDCNRKNSNINNLAWLCCNCHCLVHRHGIEL